MLVEYLDHRESKKKGTNEPFAILYYAEQDDGCKHGKKYAEQYVNARMVSKIPKDIQPGELLDLQYNKDGFLQELNPA